MPLFSKGRDFVNEYNSLSEWMTSVWAPSVNPDNEWQRSCHAKKNHKSNTITLTAGEESTEVTFPTIHDRTSMQKALLGKNESALNAYLWAKKALIAGIGGLPKTDSPPPEFDYVRTNGKLNVRRAYVDKNPYCWKKLVETGDDSEINSFGDVITVLIDTSTGDCCSRMWSAMVACVFAQVAEERNLRIQVLSAERAIHAYTDYMITCPVKSAEEKTVPQKILATGHPRMLSYHFACMFQRRKDYMNGVGGGADPYKPRQAYMRLWKTKYPSTTEKGFFVIPPIHSFEQAVVELRRLLGLFNS